jgi:hypothetical protein
MRKSWKRIKRDHICEACAHVDEIDVVERVEEERVLDELDGGLLAEAGDEEDDGLLAAGLEGGATLNNGEYNEHNKNGELEMQVEMEYCSRSDGGSWCSRRRRGWGGLGSKRSYDTDKLYGGKLWGT